MRVNFMTKVKDMSGNDHIKSNDEIGSISQGAAYDWMGFFSWEDSFGNITTKVNGTLIRRLHSIEADQDEQVPSLDGLILRRLVERAVQDIGAVRCTIEEFHLM